jgi:hypothetical protein
MSAALPRGSGIPAWIRYGVISGAFAFAVTLAASLVILLAKPADLCRVGPVMFPLSGLIAFVAFLFFAAAAGFATGRATGVLAQAALAGLVVGVVSGCAVLASLLFTDAMQQRFEQLSAVCPPTSGFRGGVYAFQLGTTPPAFIQGTPPPGVVPPTPPPEGFTLSPAGGTVSISFSGSMGTVIRMVGLAVTVGFGMGFAAGAAALGGIVGAARRRASPLGPDF